MRYRKVRDENTVRDVSVSIFLLLLLPLSRLPPFLINLKAC